MKDLSHQPGDLARIELASRGEIQALQLDRMRWSLRHAYDNVPFYRNGFDAAGVHPDDLRELADLARFPFTVKNDLRDNYPFGLFAVPQADVRRIHGSSGTTGKPIVVGYTADDLDMWADVVARSIRAAGGRPGMKVHNAYGYGLFTGGLGLHAGAERLGVDPAATSWQVGIFGAEPWTEDMRREIEQRLDMHAVDIYGLSEVIGPGVANECVETKDGLHIWEDHFYTEIIDPQTGAVLPEGELGELVFTSLTKEAMPVVRYRTRDLTRLLPGTARSMRRMAKITGRSDDMMIIRGVNVFPSQIEELLLRAEALSAHYLIVLTREARLDVMTIYVEVRPESDKPHLRQGAGEHLARLVKERIGVSANVAVVDANSLERSLGKAKRVVDKRNLG